MSRKFPKPPATLTNLIDPRLEGAACAGMAPLFDERGEDESAEDATARHHKARRVCRACPVRTRCDDATFDLPRQQRSGIWAGRLISSRRRKATA